MSVTPIVLLPEIEQELEVIVASLKCSKSWLINQAIKEYIERQARGNARWQETQRAIDSVAKGRVVSSEAVHTWLDSWGKENEQSPPQVTQ